MARVPPRPHRHDVLLALSGLTGGLLLWALGLVSYGGRALPGAWLLLPLVVCALAEAYRRTLPRAALAAGCAAVVADQFTDGSLATLLMGTDIVYAAVVYGPPGTARRLPPAAAFLTVGSTVALLAWLRDPAALLLGAVIGIVTYLPAASGSVVRNHREAAVAAGLRAEQTALLAELDRTQAVAAERSRMARELHDVVANHLSAIAIHSTAALSIDRPDTSREALGVIRENSVAGLAEMRRLIGLLRQDGGEEPGPAPRLSGLGALLRQAGDGDTTGRLRFRLIEAPVTLPLPAPVELAAYRLVQESVTNALKHAAPGEVLVRLDRGPRALTVEVRSPLGRAGGAAPRAPGAGAGIIGMRERVALLHGEFTAGPTTAGSPTTEQWRVRARLPLDDAPAEDRRQPTRPEPRDRRPPP